MTQLSKGANIALSAPSIRAELNWSGGTGVPDVDASALLLGESGKVSSDADFVFYNQAQHTSGSVRHVGKTTGAQFSDVIEVDLARVPASIDRIVLAASADGGTFGQVPGLKLVIADLRTGAELATFPMTASAETAFVGGELYRRNDAWKFRAVGQGYSSGLAGLASDFGISVDAEATAEPTAEPPGAPQPAAPRIVPPAGFTQPVSSIPPTPSQGSSPPAFSTPPAPQQGYSPPAFSTPPPPPGFSPPAFSTPPPPPPASSPAAFSTPPPPPPGAAPPAFGTPPSQSADAPVNLDKGTVSLVKNQRVSLVKTGAPPLTNVVMGLGWDPAPGRRNIDLDASVIAFDGQGNKLAIVWFSHLREFDGAIQHTGDNLTGQGDGDDEQIRVDLSRLPDQVTALMFTINSFRGQKFTEVSRAFCRLVDEHNGQELARFDLSESQPQTAVLMALLSRTGPVWEMRAIGEFHSGRTVRSLVDPAARHVTAR
ncbi:MAG TPA: TerD family protein [Jatrophihabitans sp.]|jgi:stress response protein SCP2